MSHVVCPLKGISLPMNPAPTGLPDAICQNQCRSVMREEFEAGVRGVAAQTPSKRSQSRPYPAQTLSYSFPVYPVVVSFL